jgi:hypothetical protein
VRPEHLRRLLRPKRLLSRDRFARLRIGGASMRFVHGRRPRVRGTAMRHPLWPGHVRGVLCGQPVSRWHGFDRVRGTGRRVRQLCYGGRRLHFVRGRNGRGLHFLSRELWAEYLPGRVLRSERRLSGRGIRRRLRRARHCVPDLSIG